MMVDWKERYADKLRSPEEAVKVVKSGDKVVFAQLTTPEPLAKALADRWEELDNVTVDTSGSLASLYGLTQPDRAKVFKTRTQFAINPFDKFAMDEHSTQVDFIRSDLPMSRMIQDDRETMNWANADVFMCCLSAPNEQGYCSFGNHLWFSKSQAMRAKVVIAEIDPDLIRTGGNNYIHIDDVDYLVEKQVIVEQTRMMVGQGEAKSQYETDTAHVVGALVTELIKDGDCIQVGGGRISMMSTTYMDRFNDLGIHTEAIYPGLVTLMKNGNANGKRKTIHNGKAVGTAVVPEKEEYWYCHENPQVELYECTYTNDPKVIAQNDNMIAIQPCIAVDLLGQIAIENMGDKYVRGSGGNLNFVIGALMAKGGRSVHVLPSTTADTSRTNIVPLLPQRTVISCPAALADYVVTEYGIARLMGKSERERTEELIAIAHPDFRSELEKQMRKMFYPSKRKAKAIA